METKRLISLDAFRGFTIAAMILVNNPGSWEHVYEPLEHAKWNGITPTDLVFPFFLFIVGVAIAYSYTRRLESGAPLKQVYIKLVSRALKIYTVGLFLHILQPLIAFLADTSKGFDFTEIRYTGVLHRISLVFLICGFLFLKTKWRTQALIGAGLLVAYWLAMTLIPTPGYGKVMFEPGQNLAAWFDSKFLPGKMWEGTWDPEGLLSTLPAIATTITGMLTGTFLLSKRSWEQKVIYMMIAGFCLTVLGTIWSWNFPLNKNLWTSSYVLFTSGLALMTLGSLIFVVDILGHQNWTQFGVIYGSNAITAYVLASLLTIVFYYLPLGGNSLNNHFMVLFSEKMGLAPKFVSMVYALLYVGVNFIPAWLLYRKKIFIKL
ncbi:MAG: DUF5009 domain-containing protein [Bacteroidales bacterium]